MEDNYNWIISSEVSLFSALLKTKKDAVWCGKQQQKKGTGGLNLVWSGKRNCIQHYNVNLPLHESVFKDKRTPFSSIGKRA